MYTQDVTDLVLLSKTGTDAQIQFAVSGLRTLFQGEIVDSEQRKGFVYLLVHFVKSYHFLTCFFTYPPQYAEMVTFAEIVVPPWFIVDLSVDL